MDSKGFDIRTINYLPTQLLLGENKARPAVRPVEKSSRPKLRSRKRREEGEDFDLSNIQEDPDELLYAFYVVEDALRENPKLEAKIVHSQFGDFITVTDKDSGQLLRRFKVKDVLSGRAFDRNPAFGKLFDVTV